MKTKEALGWLGNLLNGVVYAVGFMTIWQYADQHWPRATWFISSCFLIGLAAWYFWKFFFRPFFAALKGEEH